MEVHVYITPKEITKDLCLERYRAQTTDGRYILSAQDLMPYGVDKALSEGAEAMTPDEARQLLKTQPNK